VEGMEVNQIIHGDCLQVLCTFPSNIVDSVVTDPPYGLSREPNIREVLEKWLAGEDYTHRGSGFMGKTWDSFVPGPSIWREVYRVLKPGGQEPVSDAGSLMCKSPVRALAGASALCVRATPL